MKIKHLFFDLDHTLWDFEKNSEECLLEIYTFYGQIIPDEISFDRFYSVFSELNHKMWHLLDTKQITHEYLRKARFQDTFLTFGWVITDEFSLEINEMFLKLLPSKGHLIAGAKEILEQLYGKYGLHLISNGFYDIQKRKMESGGILHYFEHIITNDVAKANKPDPAIFNYALNLAQTTQYECLMIGDNIIADIEGATNAGIKAIHYDQNGDSNATFKINKLEELIRFL